MQGVSYFPTRRSVVCMLVLSLILTAQLPAAAEVKPGDFITAESAAMVKDLVSPGEYWRVVNGMSMRIVPTERIDWPYKEATEKYSSQVRLAPNRLS